MRKQRFKFNDLLNKSIMEFKDKYTTDMNDKDKTKKIITADTFALGDVIQDLINKIEHARSSLMKYG
jgi:hypothetical protein